LQKPKKTTTDFGDLQEKFEKFKRLESSCVLRAFDIKIEHVEHSGSEQSSWSKENIFSRLFCCFMRLGKD
jgi:hypothetical protein